jgi:hypothetical protein
LKIAFPWIVRGFVGFLETKELFQLWDRIIGYDGLEIIAVFAAAIFVFREKVIVNARTAEDVELIFCDISHLKVIPLINNMLWGEGSP